MFEWAEPNAWYTRPQATVQLMFEWAEPNAWYTRPQATVQLMFEWAEPNAWYTRPQATVQLMFEWAELVGRRLASVSHKQRIKYFIATDTGIVIQMAHARFGKGNVIITPGKLQVRGRPASPLVEAGNEWIGKQPVLERLSGLKPCAEESKCQVNWMLSERETVVELSLGCGHFSVRSRSRETRGTPKLLCPRQCGAVGVHRRWRRQLSKRRARLHHRTQGVV
jgi:hypothetical protein